MDQTNTDKIIALSTLAIAIGVLINAIAILLNLKQETDFWYVSGIVIIGILTFAVIHLLYKSWKLIK